MPFEEQVTIETGEGWLYGMVYRPDGEPRAAVVFCHPLFEERKSAGRVMVEMARALCAGGVMVLTFDYRGCGDSSGEFREFSVPDWLADLKAVTGFLRAMAPAAPMGMLGLRVGASLAVQFAAGEPGLTFLVLWEPTVNGGEYIDQELRKKLVKEMITFGKGRQDRGTLVKTLEQGGEIDFDGYPITARLYTDLCGIELLQAAEQKARSLIVNITSRDRPSEQLARLRDRLGASCDMMLVKEQPFWNLIGLVECPALKRETAQWLKTSESGAGLSSSGYRRNTIQNED